MHEEKGPGVVLNKGSPFNDDYLDGHLPRLLTLNFKLITLNDGNSLNVNLEKGQFNGAKK